MGSTIHSTNTGRENILFCPPDHPDRPQIPPICCRVGSFPDVKQPDR